MNFPATSRCSPRVERRYKAGAADLVALLRKLRAAVRADHDQAGFQLTGGRLLHRFVAGGHAYRAGLAAALGELLLAVAEGAAIDAGTWEPEACKAGADTLKGPIA